MHKKKKIKELYTDLQEVNQKNAELVNSLKNISITSQNINSPSKNDNNELKQLQLKLMK